MKSLWKLSWIEFKLFLREPMGAFFTLFFPLMMLFCFGMVYGNKPTDYFGGLGMVDVSTPAYTAMIIAMTGLFLLTLRVAAYREQGVLRRFRVTTLRPSTLLGGQVLGLLVMTLAGIALLMLAGHLVFHLRFPGNAFSFAAALVLCILSFFALGFMLAGIAPTTRSAQVLSMAIFYPMLFLSGATIPREQLPKVIQHYGQILPLTHVVNLLRGLWLGDSWDKHLVEVAVLTGLLVVGTVVSAVTFRWE